MKGITLSFSIMLMFVLPAGCPGQSTAQSKKEPDPKEYAVGTVYKLLPSVNSILKLKDCTSSYFQSGGE